MTFAAVLTFDVAAFRTQFPAFSNATIYPTDTLQGYWDLAICFISNRNKGWLNNDARQRAINACVAHITTIADMTAAGKAPRIAASAKIGEVTATLVPPVSATANGMSSWQWWLSTTIYGVQCLAELQAKSAGGLGIIGGAFERANFRRANGRF